MKNPILLSVFLFGLSVIAQNAEQNKVSLQDAIQTALTENRRSKSNTLRLEAQFEQLKAQKQSAYLPTLSTNYSQDLKSSGNKAASFSINMNIFNGFADYYAIKAGECNYKLTEASYKSTNSNQQNTTGQIIGTVANRYTQLVSIRLNRDIEQITLNRMSALLPYSKNIEQKTKIESQISLGEISIQESISELEIAADNYKYAVNAEAPAMTDTFNEIISKTEIPTDANQAFEISLIKSPEILSSKLSLECSKLSRQAARAGLYSARVDLSANRNTDFNGNNKGGTSANLSISVPFSLGRYTSFKAGEKNIQATELDLEDTIERTKLDLSNDYKGLRSILASSESLEKIFIANEAKVQSMMANLNQLNELDINVLFNLITSQQRQYRNNNFNKQQIINTKYSIQRNIGTLFDTNRMFIQ